jgi:hypothetical protein
MSARLPISLITIFATLGLGYTQQGASVRLRSIEQLPPSESQRNPGDDVRVDGATGDIIAIVGGLQYRFSKQDRVSPVITVHWEKANAPDQIDYRYHVQNLYDARLTNEQPISSFRLFVPNSSRSEVKTTPRAWTSLRVPSGIARVWNAKDSEQELRLSKDKTAGPFTLRSSDLPGLVEVRVLGHPPEKDNDISEGEMLATLSPWAQERVLALRAKQSTGVKTFTVGTAIAQEHDNLGAILKMIGEAAELPEFSSIKRALLTAKATGDPRNLLPRDDGGEADTLVAAINLRLSLLDTKTAPKR